MRKIKLKTNSGGKPSLNYLQQRQASKLKAPHGQSEKAAAKKEDKKALGAFFKAQTLVAPDKCENCNKPLAATIKFHPRAHIAHIVPKTKQEGGCPSVATHPQNRWFGCIDCHNLYDKSIAERDFYIIEAMPVLNVIHERFALVFPEIIAAERKFIPAFLLDETGQPIRVIKVSEINEPTGKTSRSKKKD